jgi:hypothetical protein
MHRTDTSKDEAAGRLGGEVARLMASRTESFLMDQVEELQIDLVVIRAVKADGRRRTAAEARQRRAWAERRVAAIEARMAEQCRRVAREAAAGQDTTAAEALLRDLERLLELTRTCHRLL